MDTTIKPPAGLRPKWVFDELRLEEIKNAMIRYMDAGLEIPEEWTQEYEELMKGKIMRRKLNIRE